MTIEKMREEIEEFCDNAICHDCPLLHGKCGTALVTDEDVLTAYVLICVRDEERKDEIDILKKLLKTARADAVLEFAERLENEVSKIEEFIDDESLETLITRNMVYAVIDRVEEEMTEGEQ